MNEDVKAFFENFIQNCEQSTRLDSIQTRYFCNWAKLLTGKDITPLPADKNISRLRIKMDGTCEEMDCISCGEVTGHILKKKPDINEMAWTCTVCGKRKT